MGCYKSNKSIKIYKGEEEYKYLLDTTSDIGEDYKEIALAEIRGSLINLNFINCENSNIEELAKDVVGQFKNNWNINIKTIVEYKNENEEEVKKLDLKCILKDKKEKNQN